MTRHKSVYNGRVHKNTAAHNISHSYHLSTFCFRMTQIQTMEDPCLCTLPFVPDQVLENIILLRWIEIYIWILKIHNSTHQYTSVHNRTHQYTTGHNRTQQDTTAHNMQQHLSVIAY